MSRTEALTRKSKRLLESGYYKSVHDNGGSTNDDDDSASVDSDASRSPFLVKSRNIYYEESPVKIFRRKKHHSGSPGRSPVLPSPNKAISVDGQIHSTRTKTFRKKVVQKRFVDQNQVAATSRSTGHINQAEQNLHHLYGLHPDVDEPGEDYAGGENFKRPQIPMPKSSVEEDGKSSLLKPPGQVVNQESRMVHTPVLSDDDDDFDTYETSAGTSKSTVIQFSLLVYLLKSLSTFILSNFLVFGKHVYKAVAHMLLFDTWLLTHGLSITTFKKVVKFLIIGAIVAFLLSWLPSLFIKPKLGEDSNSMFLSMQAAMKQENRKQEQDFQKHQQSIQTIIQKLHFELQEMEIKLADSQVTLQEKLKKLEKDHFRNMEEVSKSSEAISSISTIVDSLVLKKMQNIEQGFMNKLTELQVQLQKVKYNQSQSIGRLQSSLDQSVQLLTSRTDKIQDKISLFDSYLNTLNGKVDDVNANTKNYQQKIDKTVGNLTYLKEISDKQFVENFLILLQKGAVADGQISNPRYKYITLVFFEWLKNRGFIRETDLQKFMEKTNKTIADMKSTITTETDVKIKKVGENVKVTEPSITLETLTKRAYQQNGVITEAVVKGWIKEALDLYGADRIGLPDYALESSGGYVVNTRCSETYHHKTALVSILGIPIFYNINTPRTVIQPNVLPGDCWAFKGSQGFIVIGLSAPIQPSAFTLEHIPRSLALYNNISSAPKDFTIHGLDDSSDLEGNLLGIYRYEEDGQPIQSFPVDESRKVVKNFQFIELRVASNWGHPEFTCLYRFRVHGTKMAK